jgi:hypothetical protein
MIPVQPQPEPADFSERVRKPGTVFLKKVPCPTTEQWKGKEYWQKVLPDMRKAYKGICAYSAHWISPVTGSHSIDHFVPKSVQANLAYEWSNFRYASSKFNSRKGKHTILDPFHVEPDWFVLDFPSLLVKPNLNLLPHQKKAVRNTISVLKLNADENCVKARQHWVMEFCAGEITFAHLKKKAPFIAHELQRQGLVEKILLIMKVKVSD